MRRPSLTTVSIAENHYTADYPEEEVETDDEYDLNAYNYRKNDSDNESDENEDEAMWSDEENEATKYPWMKREKAKNVVIDVDE